MIIKRLKQLDCGYFMRIMIVERLIQSLNDNYSTRYYTMSQTYLTTQELSTKIKYDSRTIRNRLKDSVLLEGVHYIRPFGGRKILYIWERIEKDMVMPVEFDLLMAGVQ